MDKRIDCSEDTANLDVSSIERPDEDAAKEQLEQNFGREGAVESESDSEVDSSPVQHGIASEAPLDAPEIDAVGASSDAPASDEEACASDDKAKKHGKPSWVKGVVIAVVVICVGVMAGFGWYSATYAKIPNVMGLSPADATEKIEGVSTAWSIALRSDDDISGLSDDELNQRYEVVGVTPEVGDTVRKDEEQTITLSLEKNAETKEAERRQAIIQKEIDDSLANGWADETYVDAGDVVVFKVIGSEPLLRSDGSYRLSPSAKMKLYPQENSDYYKGNQDLYEQMAEDLRSNIVAIGFTSDGYVEDIFAALYSGASDESIKKAAQVAAAARDEHMKKVAENLGAVLDSYKAVYGGFDGCEYAMESGQVTFYVYGNGMISNGVDISNSSAQIESALSEAASSFAYYLQTPVTIKFIKNGALFAATTAEPEGFVFEP